MANTYVIARTRTTIETDTPVVTLGVGDTLRLSENAGLYALGQGDSDGISATANGLAYINGSVVSVNSDGFYGSSGGHRITISQAGSVFGTFNGISIQASGNTISNSGEIGGVIAI